MLSAHLVDRAAMRTVGFPSSLPVSNKCMSMVQGVCVVGVVLKGATGHLPLPCWPWHIPHTDIIALILGGKSPDLILSGGDLRFPSCHSPHS